VLCDPNALTFALAAIRNSLEIRQRLACADAFNAALQRDLAMSRSLAIDEQLASLVPMNVT
jgi:hypothetical protein